MASITVQANSPQNGPLRSMNILRDLPQVADLIELCFSSGMDEEGQSYLREMRRASRDNNFLNWAGQVMDSASLPLTGFVWEENGRIIGNASIVPQNYRGRKISLIANVATHPDYRRRGIGRALTERAMQYAWQRGTRELWLHVRDDNPTAIRIYSDLGFVERARRTTYRAKPDASAREADQDRTISKPTTRDWPLQREWLRAAYPEELSWYAHWNWDSLKPGFWSWLYRSFVEFDLRQWAAVKDGKLQAAVSWVPSLRASYMLWLAVRPGGAGDAACLKAVLEAARRELRHYQYLSVEYPAGEWVDAIQSAGFSPFRTLIWMRATS